MNLIIDIGNTKVKFAVFENDKVVFEETHMQENIAMLQNIIREFKIKNSILSSVRDENTDFIKLLNENTRFFAFNTLLSIPIKNLYKTPSSLGNDRLAGIIGANYIFPNDDCLVIDSGTAITFDLITKDKVYQGGTISPGLNMRFKALNQFTKKLPLLQPRDVDKLIGENTDEAIIYGVQNGMIFEILGYIDSFKENYEKLKVIFTGGDSIFFDKKLKCDIFVLSNLVHIGLNRILNYNVNG